MIIKNMNTMNTVDMETEQLTKMKTKNTRKNKKWLRNPDQLKTAKLFNVQMLRTKDGNFHILGGGVTVLDRKNQHSSTWTNVDVRDFTCELRMHKIKSM
jgi:hypothetical protein